MIEVRQSINKKFYYAIDIDKKGNEDFIAEADTVEELKKHPKLKDFKGKPVYEGDTVGTRKPDSE